MAKSSTTSSHRVDVGVEGGYGLGRHGAAAEGGLADVVVGAQQEDKGAHAKQVNHAVDEVVVVTDGTRE